MNFIKEMKKLHEDHSVDFEKIKSKLKAKKEAFYENLKHMETKLKEHGSLFDSVQRLTDKIPELFDHLKNLVKNLGKKQLTHPETEEKDLEKSTHKSNSENSEDQIVQHDHTIEEEAFGNESDKDEDNQTEDHKEVDEEVHDDDGQEESSEDEDESEVRDDADKKDTEESLSETADEMNEHVKDIDEHPNMANLDDGVMDKLEEEQKDVELRQQDQNDHINGLKYIDDGLVNNGKIRRNFGDRFVKYLGSNDMKDAPQDVKDHLHHLNNLFNAREN